MLTQVHESYDLSGLLSDASTDPEDAPLKQIPEWAANENLSMAIAAQDVDGDIMIFDSVVATTPDLDELEASMGIEKGKKKKRIKKKKNKKKKASIEFFSPEKSVADAGANNEIDNDAVAVADVSVGLNSGVDVDADAGDSAAHGDGGNVLEEVQHVDVYQDAPQQSSFKEARCSPEIPSTSVENESTSSSPPPRATEQHGGVPGSTMLQARFQAAMRRHGWNSDPSVAKMLLARAASLRNQTQDITKSAENTAMHDEEHGDASEHAEPPFDAAMDDLADALAGQLDMVPSSSANKPWSPVADVESSNSDADSDDNAAVAAGTVSRTRGGEGAGGGRRWRIAAAAISSSDEDEEEKAAATAATRKSSPKQVKVNVPKTEPRQQRWRRQISSSSSGGESDDDHNNDVGPLPSPSPSPSPVRRDRTTKTPKRAAAIAAGSALADSSATCSSDADSYYDEDGNDDDADDSFIVPDSDLDEEGDSYSGENDDDDSLIVKDEDDDADGYKPHIHGSGEKKKTKKKKKTTTKNEKRDCGAVSAARSPMTPLHANNNGGDSDSFRSPSPGLSWTTPPPSTMQPTPAKTKLMPYTTPKPMKQLRDFAKKREGLALALYTEFNKNAFSGKLPAGFMAQSSKGGAETVAGMLGISWNKKLNTTAGTTQLVRRGGVYSASIQLSTKVVDTLDKLRNTLCHEMCHAAAWLISHVSKPPHGDVFYSWASIAMKAYPDLAIATCHTYDINFKHR